MKACFLARIGLPLLVFGALTLTGLAFGGLGALATASAAEQKPTIDFNRQIRPLLSENCFACHGPDEKQRKAKLRLDTREGTLAKLRSDGFAVVPGKSADSELLKRLVTDEPTARMPPAKTGKKLTPAQIDLIRQWIDQGAHYSAHWAFVAPERSALPRVANRSWPRNPIDYFVLARLDAVGLKPTAETDRTTLVRRLTLDLTGLPPTLAEVDAALNDKSPEWYERVVDRLLKSPRYGEHMARFWLDAARYGDTHGLHLDNYREMWPYRDWVIRAFNANKPFDRFLVEQLAGDLLPGATLDQIVATGYNRCHVTTSEGGSIEEEVYVRNVVDQVDTNGTVLLGLSTGCARCHDHKFDPLTTKDYYQLFAFFNSIDGKPLDGNAAQHAPVAKVATPEQTAALEKLQHRLATVQKTIADEVASMKYDDALDAREPEKLEPTEVVWIDDSLPAGGRAPSDGGTNLAWQFVPQNESTPVKSGSKSVKLSASGLQQNVLEGVTPGWRVGEGDKLFAHVYLDPKQPPKEIMLQWHTTEWLHRAYWGENVIPWGKDKSPERLSRGKLPEAGQWVRLEVETAKVGIKPGSIINGLAFTQHGGTAFWDRAGLVTRSPQGKQTFDSLSAWLRVQSAVPTAPKAILEIVKLDKSKRSEQQKKEMLAYFLEHAYEKTRPKFDPLHKQLADMAKERDQIDKQIPTSLIFKESAQPKPAYILKRGEYDQHGPQVSRGTPGFLPPMADGLPMNRLGFAQWLVAPSQPLTARVAVNRLWQQCFGTGLVKTAEDFGSQGEPPSHPELLDWLTIQFRDDGWDVKKMMKRIVMSATYRQASRVTPDRLAKDPGNRLLSRGPRYRLDAEMLRDQALAVSGLLVEKVGGPSVKPPQPGGLWEAVGYVTSNTRNFVADTGRERVHRRGLYTFWKRTAPAPQMNTFDAPSREACTVRRERTNTPLQALLLLNDPQYIEAARALAERTLREGGTTTDARLAYLFRLATSRLPDAGELSELRTALAGHLATYSADAKAAKELITVGESKPDEKLGAGELAAWTMVANLVLNLDEVISKG